MRFFLLLLFSNLFLNTYAGEIKGVITDAASGEAVVNAEIRIEPGNRAVFTGLDGSFKFKNINAGTYRIIVLHKGYKTFDQKISVEEGEEKKLNISLADMNAAQTLSEVIVKGGNKSSDENFARRMEQRAPQVVNVVSAKAIEISPDLTVANVVQRVSGISVERSSNGEGQFAILRGMDKRYNYTLVNGIKIPSPDNKNRYVPLDIFPAELLERLEVYKSLLPNMEGDAVGGAINMVMKNAPVRKELSVNAALGYSQMLLGKNFHTFSTGGINYKSPYEVNGKAYEAAFKDFPASLYDIKTKSFAPNFSGGISYGRRFLDNKLGLIVAASYQVNNRATESRFYPASNVDTMHYAVITSMNDRTYYENQKRLGLHSKIDYVLNNRNKFSLYNAFLQLNTVQIREGISTNFSNAVYDAAAGNASLSYDIRNRNNRQQIWNTTLHGEHTLIPKTFKIDWSGVVSSARNELPDNATFGTLGVRQSFVEMHTTPSQSERRWQRNTDNDWAGYLNLSYFFKLGEEKSSFQFGGMYRNKQRSNFYNNYVLRPTNPQALWGKDYNGYTDLTYELQNPKGAVANPLTYDASEKISAGYAMLVTELGGLAINGGVRFEHTQQGYELFFSQAESRPKSDQKYTDVLPSLSLKYKLSGKQNLRATYFRSINRPGFFEIVPSKTVFEDYQERGNPDLKHAIADNLDVRYEFFPSISNQILFGVFYKKIKDPIEYTLQADPTRPQDIYYSPGNFGTARNMGIELDLIQFFNSIGIKANYTYTNSKITTPKSKRIRDAQGNLQTILVDQTRPLYGQSEHIANLSLLYKNVANAWDAQLALGYTGPRINTISQFADNDIWQKGFVQLDASLEKGFKNRISVFAKANNILNTPAELFIKGENSANTGLPGQNLSGKTLIRRDYYKQAYLIGIRYKL